MKAVAMDTADDSASQASEEQLVTLQIYVPELVVQKCMQFNREELIWDVKNQILAALPKELKEGFNYGLFCPPVNGRAGKFLDEERPLADYPFSDSGGYVELRYKRRIYKMNMEEKQLKQLHSRANLRRLLDHVHSCHVDKISKMCSRGLDPNFHCSESGESPLTLSTSVKHPAKVIMALVNGGAHLDFRTKDGCTVLHKAVEKNNLEALRTLLDLGSSPNYKDTRGLTTLYYSVLHNSDPQLTEMLLHDHAMIGTSDPHGWQEVHQACKYGLVQHLEHLLFYGADMNARNASGNTPLHVCAVNDQESCARVLLFRGADKGALNYANQNPHQVAVIAGNLRLAEIIKNHKTEDVVPYREAPRYNPRRRTSTANMGTLSHNHSDPRLELVLSGKPPSPCPSNHSLPHLSTSSDSAPQTADEHSNQGPSDCAESVGAGANSSGTDSDPFDSAKSTPLLESVCICIEEYNPSTSGHLQLSKGDLIEVIAVSGSGYLEGRRRDGEEGLFPAACIQEMPMKGAGGADTLPAGGRFRAEGRKNLNVKSCIDAPRKWKMFGEPRTVVLHKGKKGFGFILRGAKATSPLMERQPTEFWPSLQYLDDVDKGGVAEMAGLKKGDFLLEINGQDVSQASHEHVVAIIRQSGDLVSMTVVTVLQQPQMMLTPTERPQLINRQCATLPRKLSTKKAPLPPKRDPKTTLSVGRARARSMVAGLAEIEVLDHTLNEYDSEGRSTKSSSIESIPNKPSANATPESTPSTTTTTPSATTTTTPTSSQMPSSLRARPNSTRASVSELEDFFARHLSSSECPRGPIRNRFATIARIHRTRRRPLKRSKMTTSLHGDTDFRMPKNYSSMPELTVENITSSEFSVFQDVVPKRSRSFGDIPFLQARHAGRHSSRTAIAGREQSRQNHRPEKPLLRQHSIPETSRFSQNSVQYTKDRSSTPEISAPSVIKQNESDIYAETVPVNVKPLDKPLLPGRASCPPPSYPPPPPPVGQVIKVDVSRALGEYANLTVGRQHKPTAIMSSFRPTDSAKLYASPDAFMPVGYKKEHLQKCDVTLPRHLAKGAGLRSHSLPPKMPAASKVGACTTPGGRSTASLDTDHSSGDSTTGYPPFKTLHRSREHPVSESGHTHERANTLRKAKSGGASFGTKFQTGVPETSSPKHYPPLVQHGHDPFIPDPDYDSSDEEASTTEQKGGLVTFKALDNQSGSQEIAQARGEKAKDKTENSSIPSGKNARRRLKSQTSFDASQPSNSSNHLHETPAEAFADKLQGNANGNDPNSARNAPKETLKFPGSEVVLSEETGERIFIRNETHVNEDTRSEVKPILEPAKELSDTAITQVKAQKVPPTPPPKRSDEASNQKLQGALPVTEGNRQNQESEKDAVLKASVPRDLTIKDKTEVTVKSGGKESVPFKATIILKQTEVISKEIPFRVRNKELIHQHSAHELIHSREAKGKGEEFLNRDISCKETQWKEKMVRSPSQVLRNSTAENSPDMSPHKDSLKETASTVMTKEKSEVSAPKVAPAVPKKPKVDDVKAFEDLSELSDSSSTLQGELINADLDFVSPSVEMSTRSVRENIYNFEKRSELAAKNSFSPRRKSDVIRITLVGSQHKATEGRLEERGNAAQTMKTSKSCPKTFEEDTEIEDGNSSSSVSILSDMDVQVTRFSAETPTTTMSASSFADEWKRSEVVSPVMVSSHLTSSESVAKKPPDTPPKSSTIRKHDNINKQTTLGRRTPSSFRETENGEIEQVPFTGVMTLNRQSLSKGVPLQPVSLAGAAEVHRKMLQEHLTNAVRSKETAENNVPTSQPVKGLGHMPDHMMNVLTRPRETSELNAMAPQAAKISGHPSELAVSALRARETTESNIMTPQSSKIVGHPSEHMMSSLRSREANEGNIMSPQTTKTMGPLSAQARLLENRNVRVPPPSSKGIQQNTANEDDECLRLCQRVDKSLQLIRLQVDTLGMAAVNEPETLSELVPPPPEFNFFPHAHGTGGGHHPPSATPLHIAPPPEFSDETLARQRRQHQQNLQNMFPPSARFSTPPSTMDMPVSRRVVPPDGASYTYVDHSYRSGYVQSPDTHPHHIPNIPNNMTSSPIKTMTISRGYPPHHLMHPPIRHDNNCSTLPHPSRMPTAYSRMEHPFSPGRSPRDVPHRMMNPATQSTQPTQLPHKEFRQKSLHQWSGKDVADWLESLFLPEYKICFAEAGITGSKLANMDNNDLMGLGVKQAGHRLNMERSIKWYLK